MTRLTFSDAEYAGTRKKTRREALLAEIDQFRSWTARLALIESLCPKSGGGRRPYAPAAMLPTHLLQEWYALWDPGMEEALYAIAPLRQFGRLSLAGRDPRRD